MNGLIRNTILTLVLAAPAVMAEDETRDFYAEPGMNPFRTSAGQDATENIDPFSGNLQLSYVDLSIPGNGGLDINITRYYNLPQSAPGYANPFGYGWTMHFGRVTIGSGHANQLCGGEPAPGNDTLDNPSLEMPDGGRELLVRSSALNDGTYITKSNWKAACIDPADYTRGIVATAPDGTAYYMDEYVFMQGEDGAAGEPAPFVETWLASRIIDASGNTIDVTYLEIASGIKLATGLEASDGRQVSFDYVDAGGAPVTAASANARLARVTANGQVWGYEYAPLEEAASGWGAVDHYQLVAVVRPDGTRWRYAYGSTMTEPDYNRLVQVTYPAGGVVNYHYQWVRPYLPNPDFRIVTIAQKIQENPGHAAGTWSWEFHPGHTDFADLGVQPLPENAGRLADFTRIVTPVGEEHVYHVGYWALVGTHDILWQMGLKIVHRYFGEDNGGDLTLLRSVSNSWSNRPISGEIYRGGILSALWDEETYAPVLTRVIEQVDGYNYAIDYEAYDAFGNPGRTTEWAIYPSEGGNRITDTSYRNDTSGWLIGLPEVETVTRDGVSAGTITRTYDDAGRLESEDRFGVITRYTYTGEGDVASVADALGHTALYSDYFRGTPRQEELPDGSRITRAVNSSGTIAGRTSGRGNTTAFSYDGLNRITAIDYPLGQDVVITYSATGKLLSRAPYAEDISWDGFGRETGIVRRDLVSGETLVRQFGHDALGRRIFESDINSPRGTRRAYDAIGRLRQAINQDGSVRRIDYDGAHRELHTDENGNLTDYRYQVYGSPQRRFLAWTISPEGVGTHMERDAYGHVTALFQGGLDPQDPAQYLGYTRTYSYNDRLQLTAIDSPAGNGLITFGRDILGNMTWRQRGSSNRVLFAYDAVNRPVAIDYVDNALDASYLYDADGNLVTIANGFATRHYTYNENGRLTREEISLGDTTFTLAYALDALDHITSLTYPSGRTVDYAPDALGRATRAMPYLSGVSYFPDGGLDRLEYANGQTAQYASTARHQVDRISIGTFTHLDYDYDAAGNVTAISDLVDPARNRTMAYDGLHRLTTAAGPWGDASYHYDAFGNFTRKDDPAAVGRSQYYQYQGLMLDQVTYSNSTARRIFTHDNSGNIAYSDDAIFDPISGLPTEVFTTRQQLFDDADNMTFAQRSARNEAGNTEPLHSGSFSSEYDADHHRVRKINHSDNNRITNYVYSRAGLLLGEYDEAGTYYGNEYFYLGDQQIATAKFNAPPLVEVGEDLEATGGATVPVTATHTDTDGEVVAVSWTQLSGPDVVIDDPGSSATFFTAPFTEQEAIVVLQYTATDDRGDETSTTLTITVAAAPPPVAAPQLAALTGVDDILVLWERLPGIEAYDLYWTTSPGLSLADWNRERIAGRYFAHEGLAQGTTYHYSVAVAGAADTPVPPAVVAASPAPQSWRGPGRVPDELTSFDPSRTVIAQGRLGEAAILAERVESDHSRLYAWIYRPVSGWGAAELVSESLHPHQFMQATIDDAGNLLATWATGPTGGRSLYASYRPFDQGFLPAIAVENYSGNNQVDGDVVGVSHVEFNAAGQAWICWRQNRLHLFNNYYDPNGATALARQFDPRQGWGVEHNLEVANNVGDTGNLSCDVSREGHLLAAWERYNTYDPQPFSLGGFEYDVWLAAFDPGAGWSTSETAEYLEYGLREDNGLGIQNYQPRAAVHGAGGLVVWHNGSDVSIESIRYDFAATAWSAWETLESRSNRIPDRTSQGAIASDNGDLMAHWGDRYMLRPASTARWQRARSLPATPLLAGLDLEGQPFTVHRSVNELVGNRLISGSWVTETLSGSADGGTPEALAANTLATNALRAYWASGTSLYLNSDQSTVTGAADGGDGPDSTPPSTAFSSAVTRVKGSSQHDITLQANEPATTHFRLTGQAVLTAGGDNGGDWQAYGDPLSILVDKKGTAILDFYSRDEAGNVESTQTEILQ